MDDGKNLYIWLLKCREMIMKNLLLIIFSMLTFFSLISFSQNLIPNGDFELGPDSTSAEWLQWVDSNCTQSGPMNGPDFWTVVIPSPDRMIKGNILCNWDDDTAQSGKAYIVMGDDEAGKATLLSSIQKDSLYKLSYYLSLETFRGLFTQPSRIAFKFNNGGDSLTSPYIATTQWQHFDTIFIATANATEIKISGVYLNTGAKIDNVSLIKITNTSIADFFFNKKRINIYPNPSNGSLHIDCNNIEDIEIYNVLGQQMSYTFLIKEKNSFHLDLPNLSKGIYFIQIKAKQELITQKFLLTN